MDLFYWWCLHWLAVMSAPTIMPTLQPSVCCARLVAGWEVGVY